MRRQAMQTKTLVLRWTLTLILGAAPALVWAGAREHRDVTTFLIAAWALTEDRPYRLDIWRADARTADLVQFDLTEIVRRSLSSRETDLPKFMIRRVPDDDGEWADLDFSETQLTVNSDGR
jgi:hypothetical protein